MCIRDSNYPADKTVVVGVPLAHHYRPLSAKEVQGSRKQIGVPQTGRLLLVTGGGLGAQRLNHAVLAVTKELLDRYPDLAIIHQAGRANEAAIRQQYKNDLPEAYYQRITVKGFVTNLHLYSGAADVIITRAGATTMAEFAAQQKACIVVPNPLLTGGHQLKNAKVWADHHAVVLVTEEKIKQDDHALMPALVDLLDNPKKTAALGKRLGELGEPDSAKRLAMVLLEEAA